jgi:molybdopterin-containing oxidoreductase family iron-sulfur binding subunit
VSDSVTFNRRDFLKLVGIGVAGAASGCATPPAEKLIPYLVPPNDVLPGIPVWFASTCRECSEGCGILVKQREGRAIKIEGNPAHPINRGGLCSRGHAALQGLYDADRLPGPRVKRNGAWAEISWEEALQLAGQKLGAARGKSALITDNAPVSPIGSRWSGRRGRRDHLVYEAFAHESLREANRRTFGQALVPHYDFARAKSIVSFGADFLETWISPVGYARDFAAFRANREAGTFVAVEPRLSLTGANADEWVAIQPGGEMALALGMARLILSENRGPALGDRSALLDAVAGYTPEQVQEQTGVPAETVQRLAVAFATQRPSLAVAGGIASQSEQSVALHAAVNLLNYVAGNLGETVRFDRAPNFDAVASFSDVQRLIAAMGQGQVEAIVVSGTNPAYSIPAWAGFTQAFDNAVQDRDRDLARRHRIAAI